MVRPFRIAQMKIAKRNRKQIRIMGLRKVHDLKQNPSKGSSAMLYLFAISSKPRTHELNARIEMIAHVSCFEEVNSPCHPRFIKKR